MLTDSHAHPLHQHSNDIQHKVDIAEEASSEDSSKPFLTNNQNSQQIPNDTTIVPLQYNSEENRKILINVKKKKNIIKRWIPLAIVLILIAVIVTIILIIKIHSSNKSSSSAIQSKKVLFIIIDGIPADVIENVKFPNIKKIQQIGIYKRAYVGGDAGTYSQTPTKSAPGYMSLITGTWGNKHNVYDNAVNNPNYNYKNIFRIVKEQQSDRKIGIFSTWVDNRLKLIGEGLSRAGNLIFDYKFDGYELDLANYPHDSEDLYIDHIDQRVAKEAAECIRNDAPDLSWVYLQYTDNVAHYFGDSEQFYQIINKVDQKIGEIYESIDYRMNYHKEEWLIIITTDHGRDPHTGQDHGNQTERERTTWLVTNNPETNIYFRDYQPAIVDILPTMTRFLNVQIPIEAERELDGVPLTGNVSLIKPDLRLHDDNLTITWKALDNTGNVTIWLSTTNLFKDGSIDNYTPIGTVPIEKQLAIFDIKEHPSKFYKILLEGHYNTVNKWIFRP